MGMSVADVKTLDTIIRTTLEALEQGKAQVFDILETARKEYDRMKKEVDELKRLTRVTIEQVDEWDRKEKLARIRLMEVSRDFHRHSEEEVRRAYDYARETQVQLYMLKEREQQLRKKRDEMELRLRNLEITVNKAERLTSQLSAAMGYLATGLDEFASHLEDMQRRQQVGIQIIKAQEEERKRVAREIHDGPAQSMANVVLRAEVCEKLLDTNLDEARKELRALKELVRASLRDVRRIIFDLRPMTLDDLGLVPTLRHIGERYKGEKCFNMDVQVIGREKRLTPPVEVALYRIISEALQNCAKHANAKNVTVRLEFQPEQIAVQIEDDGCGFNPAAVKTVKGEHFGLISMEERTSLLDGKLEIQSVPGKGTKIGIIVPYGD